jgi:transcriptional regulator with XRE-family HTH domain
MTPDQCRMARAAVKLGIKELSTLAKISTNTLVRFERGEKLKDSTIETIQAVLEAAGVEFISANGGGPGVRLKRKPRRR